MNTITIHLDEQVLQLRAGSTLAELLAQQARPPESCATALNGRFVSRQARPDTLLNEGDLVLLFKPIVGG